MLDPKGPGGIHRRRKVIPILSYPPCTEFDHATIETERGAPPESERLNLALEPQEVPAPETRYSQRRRSPTSRIDESDYPYHATAAMIDRRVHHDEAVLTKVDNYRLK